MFKHIIGYLKIIGVILLINILICLLIWISRDNKSVESLSNILFYSSGLFAIITYFSTMGSLRQNASDRYYSYIGSIKKSKEDSLRNYMELQDKSMNFSIILGLVAAINIIISLLILKF